MKEKNLTALGIKRLVNYLRERFCPFNVRTFQSLVGIITTILLGTVLILGWMSSKKVKEVVTEDFNQQQLVLARHAARQIENSLSLLKRELSLLSLSPSIQYYESVFMDKRMGITFSSIKDEGGLEVRFIQRKDKAHVVDAYGYQTLHPYPEDLWYLEWAQRKENKGAILISDVLPSVYGSNYQKLILKMAIPVWQVSVDESHQRATNKFSGVLIFVADATELVGRITQGIRSGKTGYAWIIDEKGTFLYHPEEEFIGKNAFEARKEKRPTISFARINEIQKEMMLTGKEGTSWYISGWHRGKEEEMKKLIAYAPIRLGDNAGNRLWSVAVVAPISEVEGAIHSIHIRQFSLQAIFIAVILLGGLTIISMMLNWSNSLEQKVGEKTAELKKSEQRYKSLVENAEDIIFTVDYDGNFLSINNHGTKFFQRNSDKIIGHHMSEILSWSGAEVPLLTVKEVFDTKKGKQITHPVKIGEREYWLNTNFRRLLDEEGNIYAVLGISRDITDRKKMEERGYHTEKLASMGTLAAGVAHEINNPLAIILGFTDLLLGRIKPGTEEYDMLQTMAKHGLRAKRIVQNLLSFARYTEHGEELVDINKDIETVLSVVGNTLLMNKISLEQRLKPGLPAVKGYAEELQQVFFNIVTNAISAMKGEGGTLTITTGTLGNEHVEIRFADTGHGIEKEHRSRVFDPLFTTKKIGEGTGLGLSVSYGIITKHGGVITFETKTKEESPSEHGTTFIIRLPAVKNANTA